MNRWFRWYRGTSENPKFRLAARNGTVTGRNGEKRYVTLVTVMAVWQVLLEDAASENHRGVCEKREDFIAAALDISDVEDVNAALRGLEYVGLISVGIGDITIRNWDKWQYNQDVVDPTAADRQKRFRERKRGGSATETAHSDSVTGRNGSVTPAKRPDTDTDTETEKKKDVCPKPVRTPKPRKAYPDDFEAFWKAYPTDANQSKAEALTAWQRLGDDDRQQAIASVPGFLAFCAKDPTYRPIHACRYLTKRRFEGHSTGPPVQTLVYTGPTRRDRTEAEIEALLLAEEEKDNARDHGDELPAGSVDMRQVQSA